MLVPVPVLVARPMPVHLDWTLPLPLPSLRLCTVGADSEDSRGKNAGATSQDGLHVNASDASLHRSVLFISTSHEAGFSDDKRETVTGIVASCVSAEDIAQVTALGIGLSLSSVSICLNESNVSNNVCTSHVSVSSECSSRLGALKEPFRKAVWSAGF